MNGPERSARQFEDIFERSKELEQNARRRAILLTIIPILVGIMLVWVAGSRVSRAQKELSILESELRDREERVQDLEATQEGLLDFLGMVTSDEPIRLLDRAVDWELTKETLLALPASDRKRATLSAILLAWKEIQFTLDPDQNLVRGFDSPRFLRYVLLSVGVEVPEPTENVRMSDALMQSFELTEDPQPGDLIFYSGRVGSFGLMYLSVGRAEGQGVGVGTLEPRNPLMILDSSSIRTDRYPFIGYFRVVYPDEM